MMRFDYRDENPLACVLGQLAREVVELLAIALPRKNLNLRPQLLLGEQGPRHGGKIVMVECHRLRAAPVHLHLQHGYRPRSRVSNNEAAPMLAMCEPAAADAARRT